MQHVNKSVSVFLVVPPFPHHFQVPITLVPTVQPFCPASLVYMQCGKLHCKQMGRDVYTEYTHTKHI